MGCGQSKAASAVQSHQPRGTFTSQRRRAFHRFRILSTHPFCTFFSLTLTDGKAHSNLTSNTKKTSDDSVATASTKPVLDPKSDIPQRRSSARQGKPNEWAVQPGYSSGASSLDGSDDDSDHGGSPRGSRSKRNGLDRSKHSETLGLGELRQEMAENGDICQSVVRIETTFGRTIEEIYDGVHEGPVLGSGVAGVVRLVTHRATGLRYAVKTLDLGR